MIDLRCPTPKCDKKLGKAHSAHVAPLLLLWCKRCKCEVTPYADIGDRMKPPV